MPPAKKSKTELAGRMALDLPPEPVTIASIERLLAGLPPAPKARRVAVRCACGQEYELRLKPRFDGMLVTNPCSGCGGWIDLPANEDAVPRPRRHD